MDEEEIPCVDCDRDCDGWEMQYCCAYCMWVYEDDPPCDRCDPMDL